MEVGDNGVVGPSRLGYSTNTEQLLLGRPTANVTCATRASPVLAYDVHTHWHEAKMRMRIPSMITRKTHSPMN